jgi:hypothetical protein
MHFRSLTDKIIVLKERLRKHFVGALNKINCLNMGPRSDFNDHCAEPSACADRWI